MMNGVRRYLLLAGLVVVVAAVVISVQHASRNRYYALLTTGDEAAAAANVDAAIAAYSGALGVRPDSMVAHLRRGEAYRLQHHDDAAIHDLQEAIRLAPSATQPLEALGDLYDERGQPAEAATAYAQFVAIDGGEPAVLYKLALARYRSGAPAGAIDPLRRAVTLRDTFGEAHYLLGLALRDTQDIPGAIAALEHALHVTPSLTAAREELADLYRVKNRRGDEMVQLQALATRDPRVERDINIALAQARSGDYDVAIATLLHRADATTNADIELSLGRVYLAEAERRDDQAAIVKATDVVQRALRTTTSRNEALALLGRARWLAGDAAGAERLLREAVATTPVDPLALGYLADACERQSHFDDARDALAKQDALEGDTVPIEVRAARLRRLGALALATGDAATAANYLQQAVAHGRHDGATLAALADAAWRAGQQDVARQALAQASREDPGNPSLARLKRLIK